jgi:hypothetical protein
MSRPLTCLRYIYLHILSALVIEMQYLGTSLVTYLRVQGTQLLI